MKTKAKLTLGVGVLFALILLQALVGAWQMHRISAATKNILKDNYLSLNYACAMLQDLDQTTGSAPFEVFQRNLTNQEKNITEVGEADATMSVRAAFNQHLQDTSNHQTLKTIRSQINQIMELNLAAIQRKNAEAETIADKTILLLSVIGTICFLIAFTFLFNLPASIANPIQALTESTRQIAAGNYDQQVHVDGRSEFNDLARSFNVMAAKLQEYNSSNLAKLMTEKKRIETLIDNMHDPVFGLDEQLQVIFVNTEASNICGLKPADMIGKPIKELAVSNDLIRSLTLGLNKSNPSPAQTSSNQIVRIYAHEKESYFEKEIIGISIPGTEHQAVKHLGYVILLRNITSYKELDLAKTNFIATISHEFKTPITSIKMSLQLLEDERTGATLNPEQHLLVQHIREDAERLLRITRELLDMSQVESGKIQLNMTATDPVELMKQAMEATQVQAAEKNVKLVLEAPEMPVSVKADVEKATWVLINLLTNAIHYSYENATIKLSVGVSGAQVLLKVEDSGKGIEPQYRQKIFDRFFRPPGSRQDGTGLGLAISKDFIEAHGGTIEVDSELGAGTTFTVALPLADN